VHLLYCDETNLEERPGDFLIYGGITIDASRALDLSKEIDEIRRRARVPKSFRLNVNPGPVGFSHDDFITLKQAVLQAAQEYGVRLLVYMVLHNIAATPDEARRYGINTICYHFNCILNRLNDSGLVLIDRFNDKEVDEQLVEKFSVGVCNMPYSDEIRLNNIVGFHYSAIGQSHLPSVVDIVLGALRFAVIRHTRGLDLNEKTARTLLGLLSPLFYRTFNGKVDEISLIFSPKEIRHAYYRRRYQELKDYLTASRIEADQVITECRMY